jgi:hypothetical protein
MILLSYHLRRVLLDGCLHSGLSANNLVFCAHHTCPFQLHVLPISSSSIGLSFHLLKINIVKLLIGGLLRTLHSLSHPNAACPQISLPSNAKECYRAAFPDTWAALCCKWNRPVRSRDSPRRLVAWLILLLHFLHEPEFVIVTARLSQ